MKNQNALKPFSWIHYNKNKKIKSALIKNYKILLYLKRDKISFTGVRKKLKIIDYNKINKYITKTGKNKSRLKSFQKNSHN